MKKQHAALIAFALALTGAAHAQKTYTPAQLRSMVNAGKFPKQGPTKTMTEAVNFEQCVAKVREIVASVRPNYPTKNIVSTNLLWTEKIWTNDAAMTLSCSGPDQKLIITTAAYL